MSHCIHRSYQSWRAIKKHVLAKFDASCEPFEYVPINTNTVSDEIREYNCVCSDKYQLFAPYNKTCGLQKAHDPAKEYYTTQLEFLSAISLMQYNNSIVTYLSLWSELVTDLVFNPVMASRVAIFLIISRDNLHSSTIITSFLPSRNCTDTALHAPFPDMRLSACVVATLSVKTKTFSTFQIHRIHAALVAILKPKEFSWNSWDRELFGNHRIACPCC